MWMEVSVIQVQKGGLDGTLGVSFQTNFSSFQAGITGGIGLSSNQTESASNPNTIHGSLLGVTLSTGSNKPSLELGGLTSSAYNGKSGQISTQTNGWSWQIPVYYGINLDLGYSKTRYWSDETTTVSTHGSLFPNGWGGMGNAYGSIADNAAYDEYALLEDPSYTSIIYSPDPTKVQGGSFPDFDVYSVNAQGLGGNIRPYLLQGELVSQNIDSTGTPVVTYYSPGVTDNTPAFRFENDFSNMYQQNTGVTFNDPSLNLRAVTAPFDVNPTYGNNDGNYGYSGGNNLAGSRNVSTTIQVHPRQDLGYVQSERLFDGHMIEGFSITNESGMTYHFGLPAYSYNEQNYQQLIPTPGNPSLVFTRDSRPSPYAYTWYLTTITGPDYVDRNGNGIADDGDWGYWVDFEYGKWSDGYVWRNPSEGYQRDQDNQYEDCSIGSREVYYLNAIRTRSHVALFEKTIRQDGKGESGITYDTNTDNNAAADYEFAGLFDNSSEQSLQLSHIYILNAADENFVNPAASGNTNILDDGDVAAVGRANLEAKALRVIDFNYDYSLCPGTSNSFNQSTPSVKSGKLTLNSVVTRGKGGANLLPATQFSYELTGSQVNTATGASLSAGSFSTTNGNFQVGDMIMESGSPNVYCGVITNASPPSGGVYTYTLQNGNYTGGTVTATVFTTKNPPYNKDAYDDWGLYKSDYHLTQITDNDNLGRTTSPASARGADAWSLHRITTGLGSQIQLNYESDNYYKSVLSSGYSFVATAISQVANQSNQLQITFGDVNNGMNTYFGVGNQVNCLMLLRSMDPNAVLAFDYPSCGWASEIFDDQVYDTRQSTNATTVAAVGSNYLILQNPDFSTFYQTPVPVVLQSGQRANTTCFKNKNPIACNLRALNSIVSPGGGTRVKEIDVLEPLTGFTSSMAYNYNQPASSGVSSGVTSYEPWGLDIFNNLAPNTNDVNGPLMYKAALYKDINGVLAISREAPPPGVYYQYVTATKVVQDPDEPQARSVNGSVQYEFEVFRPNMLGRVDIPGTSTYTVSPGRTSVSTSFGTMTTHNLSMQKFLDQIGQVRKIIQYDNNNKPLVMTINHYLDEGLENLPLANFMPAYKARLAQYAYQGYLEERYSETKTVYEQGYTPNSKVMATQSAREEYPSVMTGQTVINYENGTQASSQNLGFDFYSGAVTQTLQTDAYGNNFLTQTVPAYREPAFAAMGLKSITANDKNMLTQTAETYLWKVDGSNNKVGLVGAAVTTWSDQIVAMGTDGSMNTQNSAGGSNGDVWRQQSTYDWLPTTATTDGLTLPANFSDFNFGTPSSSDSRWVRSSNITLYDVYSKSLEGQDVNNNYSATHLNYGENKVILTGGPANYYEMAFSGAEDAAVSQTSNLFVQAGSGTIASGSGVAHTGAQSLLLNAGGAQGFTYTVPIVSSGTGGVIAGRTYTAAVWVKPVSGTASNVNLYYSVGGGSGVSSTVSSATSTKTANGWTLVNLTIPGSSLTSGSTLKVWCENDHATAQAYADDMRFQPLGASTTAYVYDPFSGELDYTLDNNNLYTQFQYDAAGRLAYIYKEKLNVGVFKTNQYQYNYGAPQFGNDPINGVSYQKNNCPLNQGYVGTTMPVTIPANTYNSFISQSDADARAGIYAQDYANVNGSCVCTPGFQWSAEVTAANDPNININGTKVSFQFDFINTSGENVINLGQISTCSAPTAQRMVPVIDPNTGSVWYVYISPTGAVQLIWQSGTYPQAGAEIYFGGTFDQLVNLSYSPAFSQTFFSNACPPNAVDQTGYVLNVPAYLAYGSTPQDAYNNAVAEVQAEGQSDANNDPCQITCNFNFTSTALNNDGGGITYNGSTASFTLSFEAAAPPYNFTSGVLGTVSPCTPVRTQNIIVTDQNNSDRVWQVTISTNGTITVTVESGPALAADPAFITGTYSLQ